MSSDNVHCGRSSGLQFLGALDNGLWRPADGRHDQHGGRAGVRRIPRREHGRAAGCESAVAERRCRRSSNHFRVALYFHDMRRVWAPEPMLCRWLTSCDASVLSSGPCGVFWDSREKTQPTASDSARRCESAGPGPRQRKCICSLETPELPKGGRRGAAIESLSVGCLD